MQAKTEDPEISLEILIQATSLQDKHEAGMEALTIGAKVGHIEIKKYEKYDTTLELMIDGCNNEMKIFSFPFEDEDYFHDEKIE
ncbi:hypothetical protein KI387_016536, partial [Taxus chinensis]